MGLGKLYDYSPIGLVDKHLLGGNIKGGVTDIFNGLDRRKNSTAPEVNADNFQLPGFGSRGRSLLQQADYAAGRGAPSIGESAFRGNQQGLVNLLQQQAMGQGPSAAGLQLKDALGRNVSAQQALLATGGGPAAARSASQQAGALGGSLAGQAAQARVQEQLGAQGLLSQTLQGARGQDLQRTMAQSDAELRSRGLNDQQIARLRQMELDNARLQQAGTMGLEQIYTQRRGQDLGVPTSTEQAIGGLSGLLSMI